MAANSTDLEFEPTNYSPLDEYEEWPALPDEFRVSLDHLAVWRVTIHSTLATARRALSEILLVVPESVRNQIWLETDYGWVLTASDLLAALKEDPNWDWRYGVNEVLCKNPSYAVKVRLNQKPLLSDGQADDHERRELAVLIELYSDLADLDLVLPQLDALEPVRRVLDAAHKQLDDDVEGAVVEALRSVSELRVLTPIEVRDLSTMLIEAWGLTPDRDG